MPGVEAEENVNLRQRGGGRVTVWLRGCARACACGNVGGTIGALAPCRSPPGTRTRPGDRRTSPPCSARRAQNSNTTPTVKKTTL